MPNEYGKFVGAGWSRAREDAWERVFGSKDTRDAATQQPDIMTTPTVRRRYDEVLVRNGFPPLLPCSADNKMCRLKGCVPIETSREVPPDCNGCGDDGHVLDDCPAHPER